MNAKRWDRLNDLYHAAVAMGAEERADFLTEACGDDPALQADVQRLAAAHDRASQVDESPAVAVDESKGSRSAAFNDSDVVDIADLADPKEFGRSQVAPPIDVQRSRGARPARSRQAKPRRRSVPLPPRRTRGPFAWALAATAVLLLGMRVSALIGPRADAVAAPAPIERIGVRDRVLVFDLADRVGDSQLVAALSDAFRAGLAESPAVKLVSTRQLRSALGQTDADSVTRAAARRQGVKTLVTGTIEIAGAGYVINAEITNTEKGDRLATISETAVDSADVVRTLGRVSERLRQQIGESAASIAATPRLEEVTTASLSALRQYSSGARAVSGGDRASGIRSLKAAVTLDTGFASAHRLLGVTYADLRERGRSADAFEHVTANRARLPFYERNHTVASHAGIVLRDYATAIDAYNRILERYPEDVRALNGLASLHSARREYAVQESLLVRAIAVDPGVPSLYTGLVMAQVNHGKYDEARGVLDRVEQRFPGLRSRQLAGIALAASKQDWETAEREARARVAQASDDTVDTADGLEALAGILMTKGRLSEAEQTLRRVVALGARGGSPRRSLSAAVRIAYLELRYRHSPTAALATMNSALARFPLERIEEADRPYDEVARLFADAGRPARARELVAQAARTRLGRQRGIDANRRWTLGAIAMAEARAWEGEIEIHGAAENHVCPICALPDLARAYEVAGKPDSAIATYERYLSAPWQWRFETDAFELGSAMKRLGELYQQQNEGAKATAQYTALLQLWNRADQELEPLISDVRRRLDQTNNAPGGSSR